MVYGETFLINFKFYAKTLTKLHDLTVPGPWRVTLQVTQVRLSKWPLYLRVGKFYDIFPTKSIFFMSKSNFLWRQRLTRIRIRIRIGLASWIRIQIEVKSSKTHGDPQHWLSNELIIGMILYPGRRDEGWADGRASAAGLCWRDCAPHSVSCTAMSWKFLLWNFLSAAARWSQCRFD